MNTNKTLSGSGWTVDVVKQVLANGGKIEPFNSAYRKIFFRKPVFSPCKDGWNRFFQEGAPEFRGPGLVPVAVADAALNAMQS